jgi:L-fuconolactonase
MAAMKQSKVIDIHPHIIAKDENRYPRNPLFGVQSDWSRSRPNTVEEYVAAMDDAGVDKAAIVQASTCYGYDNSYVADSIARYPNRLTGVGSVDVRSPDAPEKIDNWAKKGITGFRLFTGGSTAAIDASWLTDPASFPAWEKAGDLGLSMCIQTDETGIASIKTLTRRFPKVPILIDHLARPNIKAGPPYKKAAPLFSLVDFENVYLKVTPRIVTMVRHDKATPETFFPQLVKAFTAKRIAWGSNFPASEGSLSDLLGAAQGVLSCLDADDQAWIFAKTAQVLYPALADK